MGRGFPWSLHPDPPKYARGDCPNAEHAVDVEWQIKGSLHTPDRELIDQIVAAVRKVGDGAADLT